MGHNSTGAPPKYKANEWLIKSYTQNGVGALQRAQEIAGSTTRAQRSCLVNVCCEGAVSTSEHASPTVALIQPGNRAKTYRERGK